MINIVIKKIKILAQLHSGLQLQQAHANRQTPSVPLGTSMIGNNLPHQSSSLAQATGLPSIASNSQLLASTPNSVNRSHLNNANTNMNSGLHLPLQTPHQQQQQQQLTQLNMHNLNLLQSQHNMQQHQQPLQQSGLHSHGLPPQQQQHQLQAHQQQQQQQQSQLGLGSHNRPNLQIKIPSDRIPVRIQQKIYNYSTLKRFTNLFYSI